LKFFLVISLYKRVDFFQYKIFLFSTLNNFSFTRSYQKLLIHNFCSKLASVRTVLEQNKNVFFFDRFFAFSTDDLLNLVLNIGIFVDVISVNSFFLSKKNGFSLFFDVPTIYFQSIQCLWNFSVLPIIETYSDRYSFGFRPFRACKDLFCELKNFLFRKNLFFWSLNTKVSLLANISENKWLFKNFPIEKKFFKSWLAKVSFSPLSFFPSHVIYKDFISISYTLINFSLNGLVRF
jgi:RNA-directed DNA polymerase